MKRTSSRLCLLLLAASLCWLAGCTSANMNPAYFPYFMPTPYHNYDPDIVRLEIRPVVDVTNPVRTQHVLLATIIDKNNLWRRGRQVEFMISGVGSIIDVAPTGLLGRNKLDPKFAISQTALFEHTVAQGNFDVRPGQTWCVLTSAEEGDTQVSVYAPGINDWDKRLVHTTIHWVDAGWAFPLPVQVRAGGEHVLATKLSRSTDKKPLANYRVRYKIEPGSAPAVFVPSQTQEYLSVSGLDGVAPVLIKGTSPNVGITRVSMEVIRPPNPNSPGGSGVTIATGSTTVEWLAPAIALTHTGPALAVKGSEVTYETVITNVGKVETKEITVSSKVPADLQLVRSDPPAKVTGGILEWIYPPLPAGQAHQPIRTTYKTLKQGTVTSCAAVFTEDGLKDEKCARTDVTTAALKVGITGPQAVFVDQLARFEVTITNPGSGPLHDVLLTANLSKGLEHEKKDLTLNIKIDTLLPQAVRIEPLPVTARLAGPQTVTVTATSAGLSDQAQATVIVQQPKVSLEIEGTPRTKYVGRPTEWKLVLKNPGDAVLNDVVVRDRLPVELAFSDADSKGEFKNGEVLWNIGQLQAHETRVLKVKTVSKEAAQAVLHLATVTAEAGIRAEAKTSVDIIRTPAGQNMEVTVQGSPVVQVGKTITYNIRVWNSGQMPLQKIDVKAVVPPQLKIVSAKGLGTKDIQGQMVLFGRVDSLEKDRPLDFTIEAEALRPGDVRFRAELRTQTGGEPQVWEQATTIFDTNLVPPPPPLPAPPGK